MGVRKSFAVFPTAPARFQWRSARVITLCGFHLAHRYLQRDRHGSEPLRVVPRPISPSGLLEEILVAFPSRQKQTPNKSYQESPREREWPKKPSTVTQSWKRDVSEYRVTAREDKLVVRICRNPSTLAVSLRAHGCVPNLPLTSDKKRSYLGLNGTSISQHQVLRHLYFSDWYYRRDPNTPVRKEGLPEVQVALMERPKSCHLFSPLHLIALGFFNEQHPSFKRRVSSGTPRTNTDLLLRDICWMGRVEVVLGLSTSNTHFPPPEISSLMPRKELRQKGCPVPRFEGRLIPSLWVRGALSGQDPSGALVRGMAHFWMLMELASPQRDLGTVPLPAGCVQERLWGPKDTANQKVRCSRTFRLAFLLNSVFRVSMLNINVFFFTWPLVSLMFSSQ